VFKADSVDDALPADVDVIAQQVALRITRLGPLTPELRRAFRRRVNRYVRELETTGFWRLKAAE